MHDQALLKFMSAVGAALMEYAASSLPGAEEPAPAIEEPATPAPAKGTRKAKAEPSLEPASEPGAAAAAPAPAMTKEQFAAEATAVLQRHGGDQTPLGPLLASWGVTAPAQQLDPSRYAEFIAALKAAYGE